MFVLFLLACNIEIPDLMFENSGSGQLWIGGKHTEEVNNSNSDEWPVDTAIESEDSGAEDSDTAIELEDSGTEDSNTEE